MQTTAVILLLLSAGVFAHIYGGYYLLLRALAACIPAARRRAAAPPPGDHTPGVTVFFSALNEERSVGPRIENLLDQDYPAGQLEILAVSDGSTDRTAALIREMIDRHPDQAIRLIEFERNQGRAAAQNTVAREAANDILVATDAETVFDRGCLRELMRPFADERVGAVGGRLLFADEGTELGRSYSLYRSVEYAMRRCETLLGVGVKTDGACTAYRREIWRPIHDWEDVDQVIAFFARKEGKIVVQAEEAVAFEKANVVRRQEIRARSRMARKGLLSTFGRWRPADVARDPLFSLAFYSHKTIRYFSPLFLVLFVLSATYLLARSPHAPAILAAAAAMVVLLAAGAIARVPLLRTLAARLVSFGYANVGFTLGLLGWLRQNREGRYTPTSQS